MYRKLIINDIKKSKLISAAVAVFILTASMFASLAAILSVSLVTSIDAMMGAAVTPHFLQMHSGDIDMRQLTEFADRQENTEDFQVLTFLNIEGAQIIIGGNSLADTVQDTGLSVQSERFDFLLDMNGNVIRPADGEIYVPLYYMKSGQANIGDSLVINGVHFTVAGFLRDSQMNASMISSKRFLVSPSDFEKVREFGNPEYLIEFRLSDPDKVFDLETAYLSEKLPANGPPGITYSLFKTANALDDGIMIAVLILIGVLVTAVSFLCIRFTLVSKTEEDYREIGVLKTIGLRTGDIKKLYLAKYGAIAGIASAMGYVLSLAIKEPFLENIRLYMGESDKSGLGIIFGLPAAAVIFFIVVLYVNGVLGRFNRISPAQAVRFGAPREKSKAARGFRLSKNRVVSSNIFLGLKDVVVRKKLYFTMLSVSVIASFLMIVPQNIYTTISRRNFMTYMGIGECDMRIDVRQTDNIPEKTAEIARYMSQDAGVVKYTVLNSYMFDVHMADGSVRKLKAELGDHSVFPIECSAGRAPRSRSEIAVSVFVAEDLEAALNDTIVLTVDGRKKALTVCGIYSDITNGGKTAKAIFDTADTDILWSVIPTELKSGFDAVEKTAVYKENFPYAKVSVIDEYIHQTFGGLTDAVQKASYIAVIVAAVLTVLVTLLFVKMLLTKDRYVISVLKSLGFKTADIRAQYLTRIFTVPVIGIVIGTVLANTLGELVGVALISSFGASSIRFAVNPVFAYLFSPILLMLCVFLATLIGTSGISSLKISDYIKE